MIFLCMMFIRRRHREPQENAVRYCLRWRQLKIFANVFFCMYGVSGRNENVDVYELSWARREVYCK